MKLESAHRHYNSALSPRLGFKIEFEYEVLLKGYIYAFFSKFITINFSEFYDILVIQGIISTNVKFLNRDAEPKVIAYTLDCTKLLIKLSLIDSPVPEDDIQLYTIQEVAKKLSVTRQTVYNLIKDGYFAPIQLAGLKGQRIKKIDLLNYLKSD